METFYLERLKTRYTNEVTVSLVLVVTWYLLSLVYRRWRRQSLPPGPWGWPLVGYKYHFGNTPYKHFQELGKKYGSVIGVTVGSQFLVILNDYETTIEGYKKAETLGRVSQTFQNFSGFEHFGESNGPKWKKQRKFFSVFFKSLFRRDNYENLNLHNIIEGELNNMEETLKKVQPDQLVNIRELSREGTNNTLFKYIFGKSYPPDHPIIEILAEQQLTLLEQGMVTDWNVSFPNLRFLTRRLLPKQRNLKILSKIIEKFINDEIENHRNTLDSDNPKDYIDYALLKERDGGKESEFNDGNLNSNVQLLLAGGTETTRVSVEWMFMLMAKFPKIQERIQVEISQVFGVDQKPKWEDRYLLPYTMAAVTESQRWNTIVPIGTPRMALDGFTLKGYWIPMGTVIASNIWAIHNDETHWENPAEFNPEHYLTEDGKFKANERFMSFSFGKRDCPGKNQAMMELFLFLATILQKYKVLPPLDGISMEENYSLVTSPLKPFARFQPRLT